MAVGIEILIEAQDRASAPLQNAQRNVDTFARDASTKLKALSGDVERVGTSTARTGTEMVRATTQMSEGFRVTVRSVAGLNAALLSQLNPALGRAASSMSSLSATGSRMGVALGVVGAAAGVAAGALGLYVRTLNETAAMQAKLNIAVRGLDAGPIRSQMSSAALEIEKFQIRSEFAIGSVLNLFHQLAAVVGLTISPTDQLAQARAALERILPHERELKLAEIYGQQQKVLATLAEQELTRATRATDLESFIRQHERLAQAISNEAAAQERALRAEAAAELGAARARGASDTELAAIQERLQARLQLIGLQFDARTRTQQDARTRGEIDLRLDLIERDARARGGRVTQADFETLGVGLPLADPEQTARGVELIRKSAESLLATERERAIVLTNVLGITESERVQRELIAIEAERRLKVSQAQGDRDIEALANLEAQVATANRLRQEFERTNGQAGLAAGFQEVADSWAATGEVMRDSAVRTAQTMQGAFSDLLFAPLEDGFKDIGDVVKRAGLSLGRVFTDALAQSITGRISATLASAFSPYTGGPVSIPFGSALGAAPSASALPGLVNVSGASPAQIASLQAQGVQIVQGPGGQSFAVPSQSAVAASGGGFLIAPRVQPYDTFSIASGSLGPIYGIQPGISPYGVASPEVTQSAYALRGASGGLTYGQALGGAFGAAQVGLSIYGATQIQGSPTVGDIVGLSLSAGTGAAIASSALGLGLGATILGVFGAVAGVALAIGFSDQARKKERLAKRQLKRNEEAAGRLLGELSDAIEGSVGLDQLRTRRLSGLEMTAGGFLAEAAAWNVAGRTSGAANWSPSETAEAALAALLAAGNVPEPWQPGTGQLGAGPYGVGFAESRLIIDWRHPLSSNFLNFEQVLTMLGAANLEALMAAVVERGEAAQALRESVPLRVDEGSYAVGRTSFFRLSGLGRYYPETLGAPIQTLRRDVLQDQLGLTDTEIAYLWDELMRVKQERDLIQSERSDFLRLTA